MDLARAADLAQRLLEILSTEQSVGTILIFERQILEEIYKELLCDVPQSFNGLFARMQYYHDTSPLPEQIVDQTNKLRILANKAAHSDATDLGMAEAESGALCIYRFLQHLCEGFVHAELEERLKDALPFAEKPKSKKRSFACLIKSWKPYMNAGRVSGLELDAVTEDGVGVSILLRDDAKNPSKAKYSTLMPSLWRYANLNCHYLSEVAGKENYFIDNPRSLVVLEPDFLVDASSVAECMTEGSSYPELYILSRIFREASSEKMLLGKIANSIFDEVIHQPRQEFLDLFKQAMRSMAIPLTALGSAAVARIYHDIEKIHQPVIRDYCAGIRDYEHLLEPSFLCPEYGLQGRLDLLYYQNKKLSICELKSGKPHPHDVWPSQRYQVVAYNMIIRSAYGNAKLGTSSIFYSGAAQKPLRNVANMPLLEQNLMHCRNRIVGIMRLLCEEPQLFFDWLIKQSGDSYSVFSRTALGRFQKLIKGIENYEYQWFCEGIKRAAREIWHVKLGADASVDSLGHNALWRRSRAEKAGKIVTDLTLISQEQNEIKLKPCENSASTDFRQGDIVLVYRQDRSVEHQEVMRGVLVEITPQSLLVSLRGGTHRAFAKDALWALEHDLIESFVYAPFSSLTSFLEMDKDRRDLYFGLREPQAEAVDSEPKDEKEKVLGRMRAAKELYLIQGPPGTGKTSGLIGSYVENLFVNTDRKLLILSFTNRAVDEICLCLRERNVPFLRTGNSQLVKEELLSSKIQEMRYHEIEDLLRENRIYVATIQSAISWYKDLKCFCDLDEMIIDEASQILESSALPLMDLATKCIAIGDQNQLPAISVQTPLDYTFKTSPLDGLCYDAINQSLMERLYRVYKNKGWNRHFCMLTGHYRMHQEIAKLVSPYYSDQLSEILPRQMEPLPDYPVPRYLQKRLTWVDCPPSEKDYLDERQILAVKQIVNTLRESGAVQNPSAEIGIVAPYRVMIHALRAELPRITIDTVERFQGSERDLIILCFPLKNQGSLRSLQALDSEGKTDRKLNVALSRARERLIILANSDICRQSLHYQKLYTQISSTGTIVKIQDITD